MQYIENHLKAILQDCFEIDKTAKELEIDNHSCRELLRRINEKYSRYLILDSVNNQFLRIEECLKYMEGIYGKNTMINARYPIGKKTLTINRKKQKVVSNEYKLMFTTLRYSIENLTSFYEVEKVYRKAINTPNPKEELKEFMNYCDKEFDSVEAILKKGLIKEIDKCNENILESLEDSIKSDTK